jgi:HK97 family phage prohead protease
MEYKALDFEVKAEGDSAFSGFASTPDLDQGGDIVVKGAFGRTIAQRGSKLKMLWNHKSSELPIGKYTKVEERDGGLYVEGKVSETAIGRDVMTLLRDGAIDSMSIGYSVVEKEYNDDGVRIIKDLDLFEVSLVNFPMNEKAVITGVKSIDARTLENILREAGYSLSQAKAIANAGISSLREVDQRESEQEKMAELVAALNQFQKTLTGQE